MPRSYCLTAITLLSIYFMLTTTNRVHCGNIFMHGDLESPNNIITFLREPKTFLKCYAHYLMRLVIIWGPNMMKIQNIAKTTQITLCRKGCIIFQPWTFQPQTIHTKIFFNPEHFNSGLFIHMFLDPTVYFQTFEP